VVIRDWGALLHLIVLTTNKRPILIFFQLFPQDGTDLAVYPLSANEIGKAKGLIDVQI